MVTEINVQLLLANAFTTDRGLSAQKLNYIRNIHLIFKQTSLFGIISLDYIALLESCSRAVRHASVGTIILRLTLLRGNTLSI